MGETGDSSVSLSLLLTLSAISAVAFLRQGLSFAESACSTKTRTTIMNPVLQCRQAAPALHDLILSPPPQLPFAPDIKKSEDEINRLRGWCNRQRELFHDSKYSRLLALNIPRYSTPF